MVQPGERIGVVGERCGTLNRLVRGRSGFFGHRELVLRLFGEEALGDVRGRRLDQAKSRHGHGTRGGRRDRLRRLPELVDLHQERDGFLRDPALLGRDAKSHQHRRRSNGGGDVLARRRRRRLRRLAHDGLGDVLGARALIGILVIVPDGRSL